MSANLSIQTSSPEETQQVGQIIGEQSQPGDIYLLTGPLGAGKTCLTQGIGRGMGVAGHPRSPTFVLMTRYEGKLTLHHMDLYRINDPLEAWDLGLEEYLSGDGVCVIEWADQAEELFPENALWINMDYDHLRQAQPDNHTKNYPNDRLSRITTCQGESEDAENTRVITFGWHSPRYDSLLVKLANVFPKVEITD